jgi:hypothetical protein
MDCTGVFERDGMTGQTGADSTREIHGTSMVRISDWASASVFHQGPRLRAATQGRMYGSNLYPVVLTCEKALGNKGASMYGFLSGHDRREVHAKTET